MARSAPRLYDLYPRRLGSIDDWPEHLPRIQTMGFDWVQLDQIFDSAADPYVPRDIRRLDILLRSRNEQDDDRALEGFVAEAERHGLGVVADLVIDRAAVDAPLVLEHPEWIGAREDGAVAFDLVRADARAGVLSLWGERIRALIRLGVRGFRAVAVARTAPAAWERLIGEARTFRDDVVFFADTLGTPPGTVATLKGTGFDWVFSSARWWNFRGDWLLDQYEAGRHIVPAVSFPESHDSERVAAEGRDLDPLRCRRLLAQRYLFAAAFSGAVSMPFGYEWGLRKRLDAPDSGGEEPAFDLTGFIGTVNGLREALAVLNTEGPQWRATPPESPIVVLVRRLAEVEAGCTLLFLNPDPETSHAIDPGMALRASGGLFGPFRDLTPETRPQTLVPGAPLTLEPLEARLFHALPLVAPLPASPAARRARMDALSLERVSVESVRPELDGGRFPVKRILGDTLEVSADIFTDGTFVLAAEVLHRPAREPEWARVPMRRGDNDRWHATIPLTALGPHRYTIEAWRDVWESWRADFVKKYEAGLDIALELAEGRRFIDSSAALAEGEGRAALQSVSVQMADRQGNDRIAYALSDEPREAMRLYGERQYLSRHHRDLEVLVERTAARFSAWFEIFPRSASPDPARSGTFDDVIALLPMVRDMGFDVLYFPPIHPIGRTNRKGRNNTLGAGPDDPGVPYAIGAAEGGHTAIDPSLGTLEDFRRLVAAAADYGLELALDFAIQCAPDHPWIAAHPEWFYWRPDGTIRYAENPPKRYQDIVNVSFYRESYPDLWYALRDVVLFWADEGVRIFRVDNPHTKPFPFWEWMIREVRERFPDVVFLSEAFTRPKPMKRLAKLGFSQSYTYFTWRETKHELTEYLTELSTGSVDYLRPNFFPSTPDILPPILTSGGPAAHKLRAALAATLSPAYGIYGPYALCEATPTPGKEEYGHSEKYEVRHWDWDAPSNIRAYLTRLNRVRRDNPSLWSLDTLRFLPAHDENILFFAKMTPDRGNALLIAINLDPHYAHGGTIEIPLWTYGLPDTAHVEAEELFTGHRLVWVGKYQHVWLDPNDNPCAIWRIRIPG